MSRILIKLGGMLVLAAIAGEPAIGGEKPKAGRLQDYLGRLGYGGATCKSDKPNRLILEGELGAKKRLLLIDTGWGMTTLDEASARGMKTPGALGIEMSDVVPKSATNVVLIEKLTLGQSQFLNQPASVRKLEMDYITAQEDCIVGLDFLLRNFCLIDCGEERLYFRSAERSDEQTKAMEESLRRSGFLEVPMRRQLPFIVDAQINNQEIRLLVDTGAYFSMLDDSQVSRLSLRMERRSQAATGSLIPEEYSGRVIGVGKIGAHELRVTTVNTLQMGGRQWKNTHFGVVNLKSWGIAAPGGWAENVQGVLGADQLIMAGALIDCSSRKIWFRPQKAGAH